VLTSSRGAKRSIGVKNARQVTSQNTALWAMDALEEERDNGWTRAYPVAR
jgi:hypothetical protein